MNAARLILTVITLVCSALLSSCATGAKSGSAFPPATPMNSRAGTGDLLLVPVHLKGGAEHLFVFDTGAPVTLFDSSLTPELGPELGSARIVSMHGRTPSHYYNAPEIYWGDARLRTGPIVVTWDLSRLSQEFSEYTHMSGRVMGILGMDCLTHYIIQLDFGARQVRFLDRGQMNPKELGRVFDLTLDSDGRPTVVGVRDWQCVIDTACIGQADANVLGHVIGLESLSKYLVTFDFPKKKLYLKLNAQKL